MAWGVGNSKALMQIGSGDVGYFSSSKPTNLPNDLPMDALDIITVVKQYPEHRGHAIVWRCKVEEAADGEVLLLAKRKILAEDHLDYFVRIAAPGVPFNLGDKVEIAGTVQGDLTVEATPGNRRHYLTVENAQVKVLESAGTPVRLEKRDSVNN